MRDTICLMQATEAVKLIIGKGRRLISRLLLYDALAMKYRELKLRKDPNCPICGENPTLEALIDYEDSAMLNSSGTASIRCCFVNMPLSARLLPARLRGFWPFGPLARCLSASRGWLMDLRPTCVGACPLRGGH